MDDFFRVLRTENLKDAQCLIEVDDYVPLRFRTYERPLGSTYLRLGDQAESLVEILVDPDVGLLRGITITSVSGLKDWPRFEVGSVEQGLPVLAASHGNKFRVDTGTPFSVSVQGFDVLLYWATFEHCNASIFLERVQFLMSGGRLVGTVFRGLSNDQLETFLSHVRP